MKLENQVISLQQAKRLKELGISQDSFFYHIPAFNEVGFKTSTGIAQTINGATYSNYEIFAAFTVAELGVMLPKQFGDDSVWDSLPLSNIGVPFSECWLKKNDGYKYFGAFKTEAESRAAMLIYLLENNLTTAAEVNERLNQN